jgi:hypothetical protein
MDPSQTNATLLNDDRGRVLQYIGKALRENRDKRLIFIPYHQMLVLHIYILILLYFFQFI